LTGGAIGDRELAEAGNVDLVAISEMPRDQLEQLLDRELGIVSVEAALTADSPTKSLLFKVAIC